MARDLGPTPDYLRDEEEEEKSLKRVTPQQEWTDKWLRSLPNSDLDILCSKVKALKDEQKERRLIMFDEVEALHETWMHDTPRKLRFTCPGRGMLAARSRELISVRKESGNVEPIPFGPPEKQPSILDK